MLSLNLAKHFLHICMRLITNMPGQVLKWSSNRCIKCLHWCAGNLYIKYQGQNRTTKDKVLLLNKVQIKAIQDFSIF